MKLKKLSPQAKSTLTAVAVITAINVAAIALIKRAEKTEN